MSTHLITGYAGKNHIKSANHASFNAAFMGNGEYVMKRGNELAANILSNTKVRVLDGDILMQGRHIQVEPNTYEELMIETGTQGMNRNDLIVCTYTKDATTLVENAHIEVITGKAVEGTASDPEYTHGDILNQLELKNQMPLYRVKLSGFEIVSLTSLFETVDSFRTLNDTVKAQVNAKITEWNNQIKQFTVNLEAEKAQLKSDIDGLMEEWGNEIDTIKGTVADDFNSVTSEKRNNIPVGCKAATEMFEMLEERISAEESNRMSGDANAEQIASAYYNMANTAINAETTSRKTAVTNLQNQINTNTDHLNTINTETEDLKTSKLNKTGDTMSGVLNSQDIVVAAGKRLYMKYDTGSNLGARVYSTKRQNLTLGASDESNYFLNLGVMESAWTFCPQNIDGTIRLGSPSHRWGQIFSTVASISTSDKRKKKDVEKIDYAKIKDFLKELTPVFYRLISFPDKKYAGLIAQDVEKAMKKHGIPEDFGLLDKQPVYDSNGKVTDDYVYGLCYEQLITLMLLVMQEEILKK